MTSEDAEKIVAKLGDYKSEAHENRIGGLNPRDDVWEQNLDRYWARMDFSDKADWQAKEVMPEVSTYVDRFAAAMKEALVATPNGFYTVTDPLDEEGDTANVVKKITDVYLGTAGRNQTGTVLDFSAVFEEQMKMGALMTTAATVLWKDDVPGGRVAVETVDPRTVYLDHTYRNLYRLRQIELDRHELSGMIGAKDSRGRGIYNASELENMVYDYEEKIRQSRGNMTGTGQETPSRDIISIDEWIATVPDPDHPTRLLADSAYMIVANDKYLLRGPEANPYWHKSDWLVTAPLVSAPLSVYGRTYMEDFGRVADVFNRLTNLLLDAAAAASMNAFVAVPAMLIDPGQLAGGIGPNKRFDLEDGYRAEDFMKEISLGSIDQQAVAMWQAMKNELTEGASQNEIGIGGFAPNSRTSATEIAATQQSSSAIIRSIADTVEKRFLNPVLDLVWKTAVQKMHGKDNRLVRAVGQPWLDALQSQKKDFVNGPFAFRAQGISMLIQKSQQLQQLLQLMQIIGSNPTLAQAFMQRVDMNRLLDLMFNLSNIDIAKLTVSTREQMVGQVVGPLQQAGQGGGEAGGQDQAAMGAAMQRMGIGRQA